MKNRTMIGIICIVAALVVSFVIAPVVNKFADSREEIVRVKHDIDRGHLITEDDIEVVSVGSYNKPQNTLSESKTVIGKYAVCDMKNGDYIFASKLSDTADSAEDVFVNLDGTQVAISITIPSLAGGVSGKLKNGDIVSLIVYANTDGKSTSVIPEELKYVRVITATTNTGLDKDELVQNEDGTYELPTTLTLLVDSMQARLLTKYENCGKIHAALVVRGNEDLARQLLNEQSEILDRLLLEENEVDKNG